MEGNITECWSVNEEGNVLLIFLEKREKLLAHDWC